MIFCDLPNVQNAGASPRKPYHIATRCGRAVAADRRDVHRVGLVEERVDFVGRHLDEVAA